MTNKKAKMFLFIGLIVFFMSAVAVIVPFIQFYYELQHNFPFPNDLNMKSIALDSAILNLVGLYIPVLLVVLSAVRSTYKLLKYEPRGIVRKCYLLSSIISFLACIVFLILVVIDVNTLDISMTAKELMVFLPGFPTLIISFILGSLPVKKYKSDSIS